MSKLTVIGNVPNTDLFWEKLEYDVGIGYGKWRHLTDYLLVQRPVGGRRKVMGNLDMGQLVALRASIDALVAAEAEGGE